MFVNYDCNRTDHLQLPLAQDNSSKARAYSSCLAPTLRNSSCPEFLAQSREFTESFWFFVAASAIEEIKPLFWDNAPSFIQMFHLELLSRQ